MIYEKMYYLAKLFSPIDYMDNGKTITFEITADESDGLDDNINLITESFFMYKNEDILPLEPAQRLTTQIKWGKEMDYFDKSTILKAFAVAATEYPIRYPHKFHKDNVEEFEYWLDYFIAAWETYLMESNPLKHKPHFMLQGNPRTGFYYGSIAMGDFSHSLLMQGTDHIVFKYLKQRLAEFIKTFSQLKYSVETNLI